MTIDGSEYSFRFKAARRPWNHQMTIYAPDEITRAQAPATEILVNVFAGSPRQSSRLQACKRIAAGQPTAGGRRPR